MSTPTEPTHGENLTPALDQLNDADLGLPTWIESARGFPDGSLGIDPGLGTDTDRIVVSARSKDFTGLQANQIVAFTEFLAGVAFNPSERAWLIDAMAREFVNDPALAVEEMLRVATAVEAIPDLEPIERANNRFKALTALYRTEPARERAKLPETPIMAMIKAHNPALLTNKTGVIVVSDALKARHQINELILGLAGHDPGSQPYLRAELTEQYRRAPITMKAELAGSQIRLVLLRTWLADLPQAEMDQLQARLAEVIDTATDLDLVTLQLSFRSMIEAIGAELED